MDQFKKKFEAVKDKVVGESKEKLGQVFEDSELELKGKLQQAKVEMKESMEDTLDNIKLGVHDMKQEAAKKINQFIDKAKR